MLQGPCLCSEGAYAQSLIARPNSSLGVGKKGKRGEFRTALEVPKRRKATVCAKCMPPSSICAGTDVSADRSFFSFSLGGTEDFSFGLDVIKRKGN